MSDKYREKQKLKESSTCNTTQPEGKININSGTVSIDRENLKDTASILNMVNRQWQNGNNDKPDNEQNGHRNKRTE